MKKLTIKGSVLILGLLIMAILLLFGGVFLSLTLTNFKTILAGSDDVKAFWIAKAGLEKMLYEIKINYFDKDVFNEIKKKYLAGIDFGSGKFKVGLVPITGQGIREILVVSEGILLNEAGEKPYQSLSGKISLTTPADFAVFFAENGFLQTPWQHKKIYGPVHANGAIKFQCQPRLQGAVFPGSSYFIMKNNTLSGPTVSSTGITWRGNNPTFSSNDEGLLKIGEGVTNYNYTTYTDNSYFTKEYEYYHSVFYLEGGAGDIYYPLLTYPGGKSPDEVFPVTKDGVTQPLLTDGLHGGYKIYIPSANEIFKEYNAFIDKNWYIKSDYGNLCGGKIVKFFTNKVLKYKINGSGTSYTSDVGYENGELISFLGLLKKNEPFWTMDVQQPTPSHQPDNKSYNYALLPPGVFKVERVYLKNSASNLQEYVPPSNYTVQYEGTSWRHIGAWLGRLIFSDTYTPVSGWGPYDEVWANSLRNVYLSKTPVKYGTETYYRPFYDEGGVYSVSPLNYTISANGVITFKTSIDEAPITEDAGSLLVYRTANMIYGNATVRSISGYTKRSSDTGVGNDPVAPNGYYLPPVAQEIDTPGVTETTGDDVLGVCGFYSPANTDPFLAPETISIDRQGGIVDTRRTGSNQVTRCPLTPQTGGTGVLAQYGLQNRWAWPGDGMPGMPYRIDNDEIPDYDGIELKRLPPIDDNLMTLEVYNKSTGSFTTVSKNDYRIFKPWGSISSNMIYFPAGVFPVDDPGIIAGTYQLLVTYRYAFRPITKVSANLHTPQSVGYPNVCIDQYVKAVELNLANIREDNYPEYGIIYSDVPLVVYGIPKKKITIVCKEDIYFGSINGSYYDEKGNYITSDLAMNDINAKPVGLISERGIFKYNFLHNSKGMLRHYFINPLTISDVRDMLNQQMRRDYTVTTNKVIMYTQANEIFDYQGTGVRIVLLWKHTGTLILGNALALQKGLTDLYNSTPGAVLNYGEIKDNRWLPIVYTDEFRKDLPPHIPKTVRLLSIGPVDVNKSDNFIKQLELYIDKDNVDNSIYQSIVDIIYK